ncbi:MAG: hypothetical protein SPL83_08785 [Succinivibrio sp.]|nr:hypothetical protein [Succinivibrio sp.]
MKKLNTKEIQNRLAELNEQRQRIENIKSYLLCVVLGFSVLSCYIGEPMFCALVFIVLLLSILHSGAGFVLIGIGYFLLKKSKNLRNIYGIKRFTKTENLKDSKFLQKKRKTRKELLNTLVLAAQKHNIKVTPEVYRKLVKPHLKMSFSNIALYGLG